MLKTGCTSAYDLYMAVPAITDEAFEATERFIKQHAKQPGKVVADA